MSDLYIEATPDLLDGWTGPVLFATGRGLADSAIVDGEAMLYLGGVQVITPDIVSNIRLDLSRAECRDRVGRCMAARMLRNVPPNGDGYSWRHDQVSGGDLKWDLKAHNPNWIASFGADISRWFGRDEGNRTGRFPSLSVPALAALDPSDDTRLPDGSRRVDALAKAACWRALVAAEVPRGR